MTNFQAAVRCAIYTRKSSEEGLEQAFNSLDAQRESGENYIASQAGEGWVYLPDRYDDGGFTGGNIERPALKRLMADIEAGKVDTVIVYKVDRLSRSLLDFSRLLETFDKHNVAFVAVTQQFNTANSMGRLMLNVLLSFAQFEREVISERTRDKIAAARRKGKWAGGHPLLGYDIERERSGSRLIVNPEEAVQVRQIFEMYLERGSLLETAKALATLGWTTKRWVTKRGIERGGATLDKCRLHHLLTNITYRGKIRHHDEVFDGEHDAIIPEDLWQRVQDQLKHNAMTGGADVRNRYGAVLKGLVRCAHCGCAMAHSFTAKRNRRYRYYACTTAQKRGAQVCPAPSVRAHDLEQFVVNEIRVIGCDPELAAEVIDQVNEHLLQDLHRLNHERQVLEGDLTRLSAQLADMRVADQRAALHEQIAGAERQLCGVVAAIETRQREQVSPHDVKQALRQFDAVWACLTPHQQHSLMRSLIERITVDRQAGKVAITFKPTGIRALLDEHMKTEVAAA